MPAALEQEVKDKVKELWLSGETRSNIATECEIGAGSVTNIVNEWKHLKSSDYETLRELAVELKREGLNFAELASLYRRHNYIKKLGANEEQIESLISNLLDETKFIPIENTAELVNQLYELSKSQDIPLTEVSDYMKQKIEEKLKLEEEIERAGAILERKNIDIQTVEECKRMDEELQKYGLSMESLDKLASVLPNFKAMGYDAQKIVKELALIKSLKQTERKMKNS